MKMDSVKHPPFNQDIAEYFLDEAIFFFLAVAVYIFVFKKFGWVIDLFIFYFFLILIWLRSVFEADFHTDPKTKKFFLIG